MADNRGGYRAPSGGPRVSGAGAASQRSDAAQPIRVPNVGDAEDLTQGDRQKLEAGMRSRPLGRAPSPSVATSSAGSPPPSGGGSTQLPPHIFEMPSNRPGEPVTEGLGMGPGAGPEVLQSNQMPDDKQLALDWIARAGNSDAAMRIQAGVLDSQRPPDPSAMPPAEQGLSLGEQP